MFTTSADSVFQLAAHEEIIPLDKLYEICETARRLLDGEHKVGRVIARPFLGEPGNFYRTENRHDYACRRRAPICCPRSKTKTSTWSASARSLHLRFAGVTEDLTAKNNQQSIDQTIHALEQDTRGLIFSNLVDFDMLYGHRRDTEG